MWVDQVCLSSFFMFEEVGHAISKWKLLHIPVTHSQTEKSHRGRLSHDWDTAAPFCLSHTQRFLSLSVIMAAVGAEVTSSWFLSSGVVSFFILLVLLSIFLTSLCSDCGRLVVCPLPPFYHLLTKVILLIAIRMWVLDSGVTVLNFVIDNFKLSCLHNVTGK